MKKIFTLLILAFVLCCFTSKSAFATNCPGATVIPAAPTMPYVVASMTCGSTNDMTASNVTCGSTNYWGGWEAVYVWTPTASYDNVTIAYSGQTWTGIFLMQGCPTSGGICIGNVTSSSSSKTLTYPGSNGTSGSISVVAGQTYYIVFDTWPTPDSPCPGSFTLNGTIAVACVTPASQPTSLSVSAVTGSSTAISGSFTAASPAVSGYLVVRYPAGTATITPPSNGTTYTVGGALGLGTVASVSALTTFTASGLLPSTAYDFYIYSYNNTGCNPILYDLVNIPLFGSATTNATQNSTSTAMGGLWSSPATWVSGIVPTNENAIIAPGATVTVDMIVNVNSLTVQGILQWGGTSYAMTVKNDLNIETGGRFLPYTTGLTGQTINIGGNLTNAGYANLAFASTALWFNGSTQNSSLNQVLQGSGTFQGDGTNGIIRALLFASTGTLTISTTQNLTVSNTYGFTAGTLFTNGKLKVDNTAQVFGQALNNQVANVAVTNMGAGYTTAPVVFGAAVLPWAATTALTLNSRYFYGNNVYLCTTAGTTDVTAPTSTASTTFTDGTATLLYIGTLGTLGNPFIQGALTVGTQYFYGGNLYVAVLTTAPGTVPPTHTSGVVGSFLYKGTPAQVSVNWDATTQTVRSLTLTNAGSGYISSAPACVFSNNGSTPTTAATASVVFIQQIISGANSLGQKGSLGVITGTLDIVSNQAVGGITTTNGGVNYSAAPLVGFSLPTGFLNLVTAQGSGYTTAPTITVTGGTQLTGGTAPTFTVVVAMGKVVSVICSAGGTLWTSLPTLTVTGGGGAGATCAFPAGCLPTATANITDGTITSFTVTNAGFGYASAPTPGLVTAPATVTTAATAPTCRIGLYNLVYGYFAPATSNGNFTESVEIPVNRRINSINFGPGVIGAFNSNMEFYGSSAINSTSLTNAGLLNFGTNTVTFSHPAYAGTSGSATFGFVGNIVLNSPGGSVTRTFPFDGPLAVATGTGSLATGSTITSLTASMTAAPSGTGDPKGTRAFRLQLNAGAVYGTAPTVTLNYNANDALVSDQQSLMVSQSSALTGPWTIRSLTSGTGALPATGSRTTATTAPGPINADEYFAWSSNYVVPPPLSFDITRTTGNTYNSIMATGTTYTWNGVSNDDNTTATVTIPSSTFTYQGQVITGFNVCTNGWLKLVSAASPATTSTSYQNGFASAGIQMIIAPFWDDLANNPASGGVTTLNAQTRYQIIGSTPGSRQIVAEWNNYTTYGAAGPQLNFQVVLDETDNSVKINYGLFQGFNGTNNHRWTYSMGVGGRFINTTPQPGELLAQQYENTTAFSNEFAKVVNYGVNGLMSMPECNSSIKFTPGTYAGLTPPAETPPVNDEAAGAITVPALTAFPSNLCGNFYTSRFATPSSTTVCAGDAGDDVWFKFTANQPATTVRVYGSGGYVARVEVLDNALNPLGTPTCVVATAGGTVVDANLTGLTIGQLYYIRVYHDGGGVQATATATITAGAVTGITMVAGGSGYTTTTTGGTLGPRVRITGGGGKDAVGYANVTAGAISSVTISDGGSAYTTAPTVTIESPSWAHTGEFAVVVYAPAINDNCSGAIELTDLGTPGCNDGANSVTDNTQGTTPSSEAVVCGLPDDDMWFKFTAIATSTQITASSTNGFDVAFEVFDGGVAPGNCSGKTSLVCLNAYGAGLNESVLQTTTIGNTYYVRIYHALTGTAINQTFTLCVSSAIPQCISNPTTPPDLSNICPGTVNLSWPSQPGVTGYDVYLGTTSGVYTQVATNQVGTSFLTSALTPGTYYWQVIAKNTFGDAADCPEFTFTVNTPPTIGVTPASATFCPGETAVQLTATGASTYVWSPATGLDVSTSDIVNASPSSTTAYTVTGTDGAGCIGTATVTVTVNPILTASAVATPSSVCTNGSSVLTASATVAGISYCVPVQTGAACITSVTFNTLNSTPAACVSPYYNNNAPSGANTTSVAKGSTYSLTVNADAAIVSVWIDYNNNGTFEASEWNQVYTSGNTGTISITIPVTAVDAVTGMRIRSRSTGNTNGSTDACSSFGSGSAEDYRITIGTPAGLSGVTYDWTPATYLSGTSGSPVTASNIAANITYTVTASGTGYCPGTATTSITVSPLSCGALTVAGANACVGTQTVNSNVTGGGLPYTYVWTEDGNPFGGNTASITPTAGIHTYVCNVTDACNNTCSSSLSVTTYAHPVVSVDPQSATLCLPGGSPILLTATAAGAPTYAWSPATGLDVTTGNIVNASPAATTTYTVTASENGCNGTASATITISATVTMNSVTATPSTIPYNGTSDLAASASIALEPYCTASATTGCGNGDEYIANVTFGTINNSTVCGTTTYSDFTAQSTTVTAGATGLVLTFENPNYFSGDQYKVWFDWNQNGLFTDAGEEFVGTGTTLITFSINVPAGAYNGNTRMRVRLTYSSGMSPCGTSGYGEVEDYTVTVTGGTPVPPSPVTYTWSPADFLTSTTGSPVTALDASTTTIYTVTASANGCSATGEVTLTVLPPPVKTLNVTAFFEGLYLGAGLMKEAQGLSGSEFPGYADQVTIELREELAPYNVYATYTGVNLNTDGTMAVTTVPGGLAGSYWVVIKHRNSIETWSATAIDFTGVGPINYDFTTSAGNAYGSNLKSVSGGFFAIWGGDASQDGIVDGVDMSLIENASTAVLAGYNVEDVNGDGLVDGVDMALIENNSTAVIQVVKP